MVGADLVPALDAGTRPGRDDQVKSYMVGAGLAPALDAGTRLLTMQKEKTC